MQKVFVLQDKKYARSIATDTANLAITPDLLPEGVIGIYGMQHVDAATAGNTDKPVLLTVATDAAGKSQTSNFTGLDIFFAQGGPSSSLVESPLVRVTAIKRLAGKKYEAPYYQITYVGYAQNTDTNAKLNLSTILLNDVASVFIDKRQQGVTERYPHYYVDSELLAASETNYEVVNKFVKGFNANTSITPEMFADVVSDSTTYTIMAGTGSMVLTKGSATVTVTTHDVTAGMYLAFNRTDATNNATAAVTNLNGTVYKAIAVDTTTITLDRPYTGETQTIAVADWTTNTWVRKVTVAGELGVRFRGLKLEDYTFSVGGAFQNAKITTSQGMFLGTGTAALILALEQKLLAYRGEIDAYDVNMHRPSVMVDSSKTYDIYEMIVEEQLKTTVGSDTARVGRYEMYFAFEVQGDVVGTNQQADWEDIMTALYPDIEPISA